MSSRNGTIAIGEISQQLLAESASTQLLAINASTREQRGDDDKEFRLQADRNDRPEARSFDHCGKSKDQKTDATKTPDQPKISHRIRGSVTKKQVAASPLRDGRSGPKESLQRKGERWR